MIQIPETVRVAVPVAPPEREPDMRAVAIVLATRIAGVGRGGIARDIAADLEAAAEPPNPLAAEYRLAAAMLREEARERERLCQNVDDAGRRAEEENPS